MEIMDREKILSLLMINAFKLWDTTLDGGRSVSTEALYHVLSNPEPGDLVVEITTRRNDPLRFGRLLKSVKQPGVEWGEYWDIETIDGKAQRWFNCKFIRVLEEHIDPIEEAKARNLLTPGLEKRLQEIQDRVDRYCK